MSNTSNLKVEGKAVSLEQATHYPWDGDVTIGVNKNNAGQFTMKIRIPGWVRNQVVPSDLYTYSDGKRLSYTVKVNGEPVQSELKDGYFCIDRRWKKGDKVEVHLTWNRVRSRRITRWRLTGDVLPWNGVLSYIVRNGRIMI